jgi:acetolactate synthase-1/2/3 large subunit
MIAARWEGAKVILVSGATPVGQWGRWAFQETNRHRLPESLFSAGAIFDYAVELMDGAQLEHVAASLRSGLSRPGGFVAHIAVGSTTQTQRVRSEPRLAAAEPTPGFDEAAAEKYARLLCAEPFAIWVGFGARHASAAVRDLAERTDALVMCSPRAKGIFPEDHPNFLGVTGFAGHPEVLRLMKASPPVRTLVLGTRLGEFTSFWKGELVPPNGFIHVDIDPAVPGAAYPTVQVQGVQAEIGDFLRALLRYIPEHPRAPTAGRPLQRVAKRMVPRQSGPVRPQGLMGAIQRIIIDSTDVPILVDVGNSFAWATNLLTFREPGRFRVSMGWGSMGQAAAGVIGAALVRHGKAVAIVGDGALLMQNEINTAVQYGAKAVFIVLNDAQYAMIEQGMVGLHMKPVETQIPRVDFVALARSLGADGISVTTERNLDEALGHALAANGPFVVDVGIDRKELAPINSRVSELIEQGVEGSGDERK